jgi:hypothetical protein
VKRTWILAALIATTANAGEACIDRAEFLQAVPRIDALAQRLDEKAKLAPAKSEDAELYKSAAEYMRISVRLLSLSNWSCKP